MKLPASSAARYVPTSRKLPVLQAAVQRCQGCDLFQNATQAVFGEMDHPKSVALHAQVMLIGEQPGDKEDREGHPFVGPAGKLLDRCLAEAGIDRASAYVTNTVKHFKWEPRGKIRLHKKPTMKEIHACRPWLDAEIEAVQPRLIVCLGATASQSLLGPKFRITVTHGQPQLLAGFPPIIATVHPASILRARTDDDRHQQTQSFIADLRAARALLQPRRARSPKAA